MNHQVNTFYPKDSGRDKNLLCFPFLHGGEKRKKRKRERENTKPQQKNKIVDVRLASRGRKRNLDVEN